MNFDQVEEHEILRDSVRQFFDRELPERTIREWDRARKIPRSIWKRFAELGWMGLSVPEAFGGSGADVMTGSVFCEELARRFPSLATDWLLVSMTARTFREHCGGDIAACIAHENPAAVHEQGVRFTRGFEQHGQTESEEDHAALFGRCQRLS